MAAARKDSAEMAKFRRKALSVLRAAHVYSTTGGSDDHREYPKLLEALYRGRDALEDMQRRLGLTPGAWDSKPEETQAAEELLLRVKQAVSGARDAGSAARQEIRNGQIRKLDEERRAHRAWRIENGLDDPPKVF
jgi:hypothetical protein